ncbi:MAG: Ig-like domain-containing protein, partial [Bacteroidales bacterium]|nr:Ig-like domain-containing protein [Bacteroidales bacterium]
ISLVILFAFQTVNAQPWMNSIKQTKNNKNDLNFYEVKKAFNEYWAGKDVKNGYYNEDGEKMKAYGWKQFLRWEWYWETRVDKKTGNFPTTNLFQEHKNYIENHTAKSSPSGDWVSKGPQSSGGGYAGVGRINCIAFHPTNDSIFWIGAPAGGLWKTIDGGKSWEVLTDSNPVLGVSGIAIANDFETSNTIYIATGDRDAGDNYSIGVLKSRDGGATWDTTGLSYQESKYIKITKLLIDPVNSDILYASTNDGIYKTINAGDNWTKQISGSFYDMEFKPGDEENTLFAVTKSSGAPAFYKTVNGGDNWNKIFDFPFEASRVEIGVTKADSSIVYTLCSGNDSGLYGIYKSSDSGKNFSKVYDGTQTNHNLLGWKSDGSDSGGQGWYDLAFEVSPKDTNELFVGGINTWRSIDGAVSWTCNNHWWGDQAPAVHADKHFMAYRDDSTLFECNDGGVYKTVDGGAKWTDLTNGLVISQMYKLSVSQTVQDEVITGLQDNGTKLFYDSYWSDVKGGDGMECLIDYEDNNIQYGTYTYGQISRTLNHWNSTTDISANISGNNAGAWVTPYIIDPSDSKTLYAGYSDVWKTTDRGDTWSQISNLSFGNKIRAMAIAPTDNKVIYITDYNSLWKTSDGGNVWIDVTNTLPISEGSITSIAIGASNSSVVWVTISGYNNKGVFQSDNGGDSWIDISTGLPSVSVNTIVQNKFENSKYHLYAGTDIGVFVKDGDADWSLFNSGLANVVISELEIYYDNNDPTNSKLWAATYGRGLWTSSLLPFTQAALVLQSVEGPFYVSADSSASVNLTYSVNQTFTSNTFFAYLSDLNGDFINETMIGSLESNVSDTIKAIIPTNTSSSTNYKIRIKSTNPAEISIENGNFEIILDSVAPSSEIFPSISGSSTSNSSFDIFVSFSEDVYGFDINDINVTNGEVQNLDETNAPSYKLTLIPDVNGDVVVEVPENVVSDIIGNKNIASTWSIEFTGNTGINDFKELGVKIFPNPNNGKFTVSSKNKMKNINIIDISGREILSKKLYNSKDVNIDLSEFSKGIYLISINVNEKILQAKILVK